MTVVHKLARRLTCRLILAAIVLFAALANAATLDEVRLWEKQKALKPLIATLLDQDNQDWRVRRATAEALGSIGDARAIGPLFATLRDQNGAVRWVAAVALVRIGQPAVEPLIAALRDQDMDVSEAVAEALGLIGDARAVELLIAALRDQGTYAHRAMADALVRIGQPAVEPLIAALRDQSTYVREAVAEALGRIGDARAVEPLIAALRDQDRDVREAVAEALELIGDARAVEPLIAALRDQGTYAHRATADALVSIGQPAVEPLIAALRDQDRHAREACVRAPIVWGERCDNVAEVLVRIGQPAVEPLIAALRDQSTYVREAVAEALGRIRDARAVEPLIATLRDQDKSVRAAAAEALGSIGDARAVEPLIAALRDQNGAVHWVVAKALGKIDPNWPQSKVARQQVPDFIAAALWDQDEDVRADATEVLAKLAKILSLSDPDPKIQHAALAALDIVGKVPYPERGYPNLTGAGGEKIDTAVAVTMTATKKMPFFDAVMTVLTATSHLLIDVRFLLGWRFVMVFVLSSYVFWLLFMETGSYIKALVLALIAQALLSAIIDLGSLPFIFSINPPLQALWICILYILCTGCFIFLAYLLVIWALETFDFVQPTFATQLVSWEATLYIFSGVFAIFSLGILSFPHIGFTSSTTFATTTAILNLPLMAIVIMLLFIATVPLGYYRWFAAKREAQPFICPKDFLRRYRLGLGLPWPVRWTGRLFAVENPRQHERFADYFVCHGCGGTQKLKGIREVVGVIGDTPADWQQDGDTVKVRLWFDAEQRARNADIDRLEIRPSGVKDYERAVNAVINVLKNDVSRPTKYLKRVPVIVQGKPPLSLAAERMLRDTFKTLTAGD